MSPKLHGVFPPLCTPFDANGDLALSRLRENVVRYNALPLAGYVVNGSTSESVLLRCAEVEQVWAAVRESAAPGKMLIAGTGAESTRETIEQTRRAAALGYHVALVRTPSFYKPLISDDLLAGHYARVADNSPIPVLIYSVPVFTGVTAKAPLVARLARHPNIIGMKDSSGDVATAAEIIAAAPPEFQLLVGSAATLYDSLQKGAVGAVLAISNCFPEIVCAIYEASREGDSSRARRLADALRPAGKLLAQYGIPGIKYLLDKFGYFGGSPRLPLLPVEPSVTQLLDETAVLSAQAMAGPKPSFQELRG